MTFSQKTNWMRALSLLGLIIIAVTGIIVLRTRYHHPTLLEINEGQPEIKGGSIYIDGAVTAPGYYPFRPDDTIADLIESAGGINGQVDSFRLLASFAHEESKPQKININRAEAWLLKALPGIGETLARRIVDYRLQNGSFHDTSGLLKISGIGKTEYERIRDLITVSGD